MRDSLFRSKPRHPFKKFMVSTALVAASATTLAGTATPVYADDTAVSAVMGSEVRAFAESLLTQAHERLAAGDTALGAPTGQGSAELLQRFVTVPTAPLPLDGVHDSEIMKVNEFWASPEAQAMSAQLQALLSSPASRLVTSRLDGRALALLDISYNAGFGLGNFGKYLGHVAAAIGVAGGLIACGLGAPVCVGVAIAATLALQAAVVYDLRNDATHTVNIRQVFCPKSTRCEHVGNAVATSTFRSFGFVNGASYYFDTPTGGLGSAYGGGASGGSIRLTSSAGGTYTYDFDGYFGDESQIRCYARVEVGVMIIWNDGFASTDVFPNAKVADAC
jgi:hypothetical protein